MDAVLKNTVNTWGLSLFVAGYQEIYAYRLKTILNMPSWLRQISKVLDSHNVVFHVSHVPLPKYFFEKFKNLWDIWDTWDIHNVTLRAKKHKTRIFSKELYVEKKELCAQGKLDLTSSFSLCCWQWHFFEPSLHF